MKHLLFSFLRNGYYFVRMTLWRKPKMVFLFGSPGHTNLGDQAQTYCIKTYCKKNFPKYGILVFTLHRYNSFIRCLLKLSIRKNDKIFCHSGYHLTDLYNEQSVYLSLISTFPHRQILIFPQTVYYKNSINLRNTADVLNRHGNVILLCRDEVSYQTAKEHFTNCKLLLYPDIVTSLIGSKKYNNRRDGILFCLRDDVEAYYSNEELQSLIDRFKGMHTERTDTTLHGITGKEVIKHRDKILMETWEKYSKYQLVITDRYHGTIFSLIAGTPVIVLSSADHKLSSGVKWFPTEIFGDYVSYASSLDDAFEKANKMLATPHTHQLPPYFQENYYSKLIDYIK